MKNADRMLELADFLETLRPPRFDIRFWAHAGLPGVMPDGGCGAVACALGWATTLESWKRDGWRMPVDVDGRGYSPEFFHGSAKGVEEGFTAAASYFDITFKDALGLFDAGSYGSHLRTPLPAEVAARLRAFVAEHPSGGNEEA